MKCNERDKLIIETSNDVKWIKNWVIEHKKTHTRYTYYFITGLISIVLIRLRIF